MNANQNDGIWIEDVGGAVLVRELYDRVFGNVWEARLDADGRLIDVRADDLGDWVVMDRRPANERGME